MKYYILIPWLLAPLAGACTPESMASPDPNDATGSQLPVKQIEQTVGAPGDVTHGVLDITIKRFDIDDARGPRGVTFTPSFQLHGDAHFQPLGRGKALLNGDMALREGEVNPFIAALLKNGLVFQAFHQHLPMDPQLWFVHFRGTGDPLELARALRAALEVTRTPLPQQAPPKPTTPLDAQRLAHLLRGEASVGGGGVVMVTVPRNDRVMLGGVQVSPYAGISTTIEFKPTEGHKDDESKPGGKATAQVVADFSMTAEEVTPVIKRMLLDLQWFQGCLYNQEIDEHPQLFFDHMLKEGDAYKLAEEIRIGLDLTHTSRGPKS